MTLLVIRHAAGSLQEVETMDDINPMRVLVACEEIIREVWERMGLEINFREGVERIWEVEKA